MTPLIEPDQRADGDDDQQAERPEVVGVGAVEHQQARRHGAQRHHAFDRKVDRAHEDDEGRPEPEAERDHRGLGDAHEIAEGQEARVDRRDHDAEQDQDKHRRPGRQPTRIRRSACADRPAARAGRGAAAEGKTDDPWSNIVPALL